MAVEIGISDERAAGLNTEASIGRIVLAVFIDFLFCASATDLLIVLTRVAQTGIAGLGRPVDLSIWYFLLIFAAVELVLFFVLKVSPGRFAMGIDRNYQVDAGIDARENWLTILLGVIAVWSGLGTLSSWIEYHVMTPVFGYDFAGRPFLDLAKLGVFGIFWIVTGLLILKARMSGLILAAAATVSDIVSTAMSMKAWDSIALMALMRYFPPDQPLPDSLIRFNKALIPEIFFVTSGLYLLAVLFAILRFRTSD